MTFIKDENIPFTCAITNRHCGSMIDNLILSTDDSYFFTIPIDKEILDNIKKKSIIKIKNLIIQELKKNFK